MMSNLVIRPVPNKKKITATTYEIGFMEPYHPTETVTKWKWVAIKAYDDLQEAMDTFHYLNGGNCFCRGENH